MPDRPEVEILVHIEASSRAVDDKAYRSLAQAYLNFEPATRTKLYTAEVTANKTTTKSTHQHAAPRNVSSTHNDWEDQPTGSFDSLKSQDLSFRSVWENQSPRLAVAQQAIAEGNSSQSNNTQESWVAPPSVIQDSNPTNDLCVGSYSSPTRVLEQYLESLKRRDQVNGSRVVASSPHAASSPASANIIAATSSSVPQSEQGQIVVPASDSTGEVIPSSIPRHEDVELAKGIVASSPPWAGEQQLRGRATVETPSRKRILTSSPRADSEPPSTKRQRLSLTEPSPRPLARSTSDIGPAVRGERIIQRSAATQINSQADLEFLSHVEIKPPPAPVDTLDLDESRILTEQLEKLARDLDIGKRFRPASQRRALRPFERGYWLVHCASWHEDLSKKAWGFLWNYVGSGCAGWGVRCRRDENWGWIRVYCWGSIVGHIYLLLYVATERQILFSGGSWIGGDGEELITLGIRKRR